MAMRVVLLLIFLAGIFATEKVAVSDKQIAFPNEKGTIQCFTGTTYGQNGGIPERPTLCPSYTTGCIKTTRCKSENFLVSANIRILFTKPFRFEEWR